MRAMHSCNSWYTVIIIVSVASEIHLRLILTFIFSIENKIEIKMQKKRLGGTQIRVGALIRKHTI